MDIGVFGGNPLRNQCGGLAEYWHIERPSFAKSVQRTGLNTGMLGGIPLR